MTMWNFDNERVKKAVLTKIVELDRKLDCEFCSVSFKSI